MAAILMSVHQASSQSTRWLVNFLFRWYPNCMKCAAFYKLHFTSKKWRKRFMPFRPIISNQSEDSMRYFLHPAHLSRRAIYFLHAPCFWVRAIAPPPIVTPRWNTQHNSNPDRRVLVWACHQKINEGVRYRNYQALCGIMGITTHETVLWLQSKTKTFKFAEVVIVVHQRWRECVWPMHMPCK